MVSPRAWLGGTWGYILQILPFCWTTYSFFIWGNGINTVTAQPWRQIACVVIQLHSGTLGGSPGHQEPQSKMEALTTTAQGFLIFTFASNTARQAGDTTVAGCIQSDLGITVLPKNIHRPAVGCAAARVPSHIVQHGEPGRGRGRSWSLLILRGKSLCPVLPPQALLQPVAFLLSSSSISMPHPTPASPKTTRDILVWQTGTETPLLTTKRIGVGCWVAEVKEESKGFPEYWASLLEKQGYPSPVASELGQHVGWGFSQPPPGDWLGAGSAHTRAA